MSKTICDKCKNNRACNTFDKSRGIACKDFERKNEKGEMNERNK